MTEPSLADFDKWSAGKIMGWTLYWDGWRMRRIEFESPIFVMDNADWNPTANIAQAWTCLEKYKWAEPEISYNDEQHCWLVTFNKGPSAHSQLFAQAHENASTAIMRALWQAMK